jgi:hypothetical protein
MNGGRFMWSKNIHILIALSAAVAIGISSVPGEPIRPEGASKSKVIQYTDLGEQPFSPMVSAFFDYGQQRKLSKTRRKSGL